MIAKNRKIKGFTLIELLVVLAVLALFAAIIMASITNARLKSRDTRRIADMNQIQRALELYLNTYNKYPTGPADADGCSVNGTSFDVGRRPPSLEVGDTFIEDLRTSGMMPTVPGDPIDASCGGYRYYYYTAGGPGGTTCDPAWGAFYVLEIADMEGSSGTYKDSPGFSCPGYGAIPTPKNWQNDAEWVMGRFEKR